MNFSVLQNGFWAAGFGGHLILLAVLIHRGRARTFPIFTLWIAYHVVQTIALFFVSRFASTQAYFYAYWSFALGDYALQIGLILEIAANVLRPTGRWIRDAQAWFLLWGAVGIVAAAALTLELAPSGTTGLEAWTGRSWIFISFVTCELYISMASAANWLGLQWRSHVMVLGEGLMLWAASSLLADAAQYITGWDTHAVLFNNIRSIVYLASLTFWIFSFASAKHERDRLSTGMQEYLRSIRKQNRDSMGIIKPIQRGQ